MPVLFLASIRYLFPLVLTSPTEEIRRGTVIRYPFGFFSLTLSFISWLFYPMTLSFPIYVSLTSPKPTLVIKFSISPLFCIYFFNHWYCYQSSNYYSLPSTMKSANIISWFFMCLCHRRYVLVTITPRLYISIPFRAAASASSNAAFLRA